VSAVVSAEMQGDMVLLTTRNCIECNHPGQVRVPRLEYQAWRDGGLIQDAMPSLSAAERELIISGTHGECYDKIFDADEEDDWIEPEDDEEDE
jgi:hypothetical protein